MLVHLKLLVFCALLIRSVHSYARVANSTEDLTPIDEEFNLEAASNETSFNQTEWEEDGFKTDEAKLQETIIRKCDLKSKVRPLADYTKVFKVRANYIPLYFRGLEDREQMFKLVCEIDFTWHHPCTSWINTSYGNIDYFRMTADETYYPTMSINNAMSEITPFDDIAKRTQMYFYADGSVFWPVMWLFSVFCELDFKKFPFDKQDCSIVLESWENNRIVQLFLKGKGLDIESDDFISDADIWELNDAYATNTTRQYAGSNLVYDQVVVTFHFARKYQSYMISIFLSALVLQFLILLSGFMPGHHPDRAVFCITVLLAYVVLQSIITSSMPKSAELAYVVVFFGVQLAASFLITVYALVTNELSPREYFKRDAKITLNLSNSFSRNRFIDICFYGTTGVVVLLTDFIIFGLITS